MSTARKILWNVVSQVLGKLGIALLSLVSIKILTVYLGTKGYGDYTMIYEFLAFFGVIADLGLFTIAVREMSRDEEQTPIIIGNVLSMRTFLSIIAMLMAIISVWLIPAYKGSLVPMGVSIAAITVWLSLINGSLTSILQVHLKMQYASWTMFVGKIVSVLYMLFVIFIAYKNPSDTSFIHLIFAGNIGNLVMTIYTWYYASKLAKIRHRFDWYVWKNVLIASVPYGIALVLNTVYFRINSIFISFIRGNEEVGLYGVAMRILEAISIVPLYFMNAVLPVLTRAIKEQSDKYQKIIQYSFEFLTMASWPLVAGGYVLSYPLIFIISKPEFMSRVSDGFYGSDSALRILLFASLFSFINILFQFIIIAVGKQTKLFWVSLIAVIANVLINLYSVPRFGFRGAALTSVICEFVMTCGLFYLSHKYLTYHFKYWATIKAALSAIVMGIIIKLLFAPLYSVIQNWSVFVLIVLGGAIYVGLLIATKTLTKDMLNMIRRPDKQPEMVERSELSE
jgi:O-antigen/teichoic acid export membrane protein